MNRRSILSTGAVVLLCGTLHCYTGIDHCPKHQWGYTLEIADDLPMGNPDGEFDATCLNSGGLPFEPDLPPNGTIRGSTTVAQEEHDAVKAVILAIEEADWSGVFPGQADLYLDVVHSDDL